MEYSSYHVNVPQWREITVGSHLPAELRRFAEMVDLERGCEEFI